MAELSHPSPQAKLALVADPSATHGGATLYQQRNPGGPWEPLGFFSKKLNNAQVSYRAFNRELLAAFSAMRHLRLQVEGHPFQLWTDHRPLTFSLGHFSDAWTPHQQWQLSYIAEYTSHILYIPGVDKVVANTLSRPPAGAAQQPQACAQPPAAVISSSGAGYTQPPQAASLCVRPPAAVISHVLAGAAQQPQAASLCAWPDAAIFNQLQPTSVFLSAGVEITALVAAQGSCTEVATMAGKASLRVSSATFQGVSSSVTSPPEHPTRCCHRLSGMQLSPLSTPWPTRASGPPSASCQPDGWGQAYLQTSPAGLGTASSTSGPR